MTIEEFLIKYGSETVPLLFEKLLPVTSPDFLKLEEVVSDLRSMLQEYSRRK